MKIVCYIINDRYYMNVTSENDAETKLLKPCGKTIPVHDATDINKQQTFAELTIRDITADNYETKVVDLGIPGVPERYKTFERAANKHEAEVRAKFEPVVGSENDEIKRPGFEP